MPGLMYPGPRNILGNISGKWSFLKCYRKTENCIYVNQSSEKHKEKKFLIHDIEMKPTGSGIPNTRLHTANYNGFKSSQVVIKVNFSYNRILEKG